MKLLRPLGLLLALVSLAAPASAQRVAKYGADFLAGGVGARALGMGGAYVALANDVTAGYWNPAGLHRSVYPEAAYMHAERFDGIVQFDYGAAAFPINARSTIGVSIFRSGVDDIPNTLNAWDGERDAPNPDAVTFFSAADYAFFVSYARQLRENLAVGASAKVIRRSIGDFASAWGYSVDVGAQYRVGRVLLGLNVQDVTGMLQSWSVNSGALQNLEEVFGQDMPAGGSEIVLPVARLGAGVELPLTDDLGFTVGADLDLAFDGQRAYAFNAGEVSFHPRLGTELSYKGVVALRAGISDVTASERFGTQLTPTVGVGLNVSSFQIDYGFGDFGGIRQELGYSHRISLKFTLHERRFARAGHDA